ncbi:unnamed protein product [Caenorhabditis sp. 36 PRJEB53466]|nr:unnamed protein product [Caenorhabditis sp. 36 PRJEB53466]
MTLALFLPLAILLPYSFALECINSTSYMDRMLVKPMGAECRLSTALCVKTMQISKHKDGTPKVLSIHRECYELEPPMAVRSGRACVDSYDEDDPISRRIGMANLRE